MNKRKGDSASILPQLGDAHPDSEYRVEVKNIKEKQYRLQEVSVELPVVTELDGYTRRHVDCKLTLPQAHALKAVMYGLQLQQERLSNGRPISSIGCVVRYIADKLAEAYADNNRTSN